MSRKYPLSYPAPAQTKFQARIEKTGSLDYYNAVFGSAFMRGTFKKISGHGIVPILIGVLAVATGSLQMPFRSMAVIISAVWLSLDIGVWISEAKWSKHLKILAFCIS